MEFTSRPAASELHEKRGYRNVAHTRPVAGGIYRKRDFTGSSKLLHACLVTRPRNFGVEERSRMVTLISLTHLTKLIGLEWLMNFLKFCCGSVEVVEHKIGFSTQMIADSSSVF